MDGKSFLSHTYLHIWLFTKYFNKWANAKQTYDMRLWLAAEWKKNRDMDERKAWEKDRDCHKHGAANDGVWVCQIAWISSNSESKMHLNTKMLAISKSIVIKIHTVFFSRWFPSSACTFFTYAKFHIDFYLSCYLLRIISRKWNRNTATTATKHREVYVRTREMLMQIWCRRRCLENNERKRYEMVWQQQCEQQHLTNFELYGKHTWNIWPSCFVWSPYYGHEIVCACFFFSLLIVSTKFSWELSIASIRQQSMIQAIQQIIDYTFYTISTNGCTHTQNIFAITYERHVTTFYQLHRLVQFLVCFCSLPLMQ